MMCVKVQTEKNFVLHFIMPPACQFLREQGIINLNSGLNISTHKHFESWNGFFAKRV